MLRPKSTHGYIPGLKTFTTYTCKKTQFSVLETIAEDFLATKVMVMIILVLVIINKEKLKLFGN